MINKGFTLIELSVVVAIAGILLGLVLTSFSKLNQKEILDKEVLLAVSILNEARANTLAAKDNASYGVRLESSRIILFKSPYNGSESTNRITLLDSRVALRDISLSGGGAEVVFNRLTGTSNQSGSFEIYLTSSTTQFKVIRVRQSGIIE